MPQYGCVERHSLTARWSSETERTPSRSRRRRDEGRARAVGGEEARTASHTTHLVFEDHLLDVSGVSDHHRFLAHACDERQPVFDLRENRPSVSDYRPSPVAARQRLQTGPSDGTSVPAGSITDTGGWPRRELNCFNRRNKSNPKC